MRHPVASALLGLAVGGYVDEVVGHACLERCHEIDRQLVGLGQLFGRAAELHVVARRAPVLAEAEIRGAAIRAVGTAVERLQLVDAEARQRGVKAIEPQDRQRPGVDEQGLFAHVLAAGQHQLRARDL